MTCKTMVVMGGGVMGQGISRLFAGAGISVTMVDTREVDFTFAGVTVARELPRGPAPDLVVEAVFEDRDVKHAVFEAVETAYGGRPVLATNTSGLPLNELAVGLMYPHRFLAMHFFMPADLFPMIEVVRADRTEDAAVDLAVSAIEQAGREPILLQRAVNGYLINRLQHSILHEAYHMIEDGIVTAEMVDKVAKRLLGPRMCITGLLEQKDLAGLVMHAQAQRSIVPSLSHTAFHLLLQNMVARGDIGIRSGRGFYDWTGRDTTKLQGRANEQLQRLLAFLDATIESHVGAPYCATGSPASRRCSSVTCSGSLCVLRGRRLGVLGAATNFGEGGSARLDGGGRDEPRKRPRQGSDELRGSRFRQLLAPVLRQVDGLLGRTARAPDYRHRHLRQRVQQLPSPDSGAGRCREARGAGLGRPALRLPDDLARRGFPEPHEPCLPQFDVDGRRRNDPRPTDGFGCADRRLRQDRPRPADGGCIGSVPAIQLVVGPMMTGRFRGERLGACTDCRRFWARHRSGEITKPEIMEVEDNLAVTAGTCAVMGTASTMACLSEALGISLPGSAAVPAVHADRLRIAEASGVQAVRLAASGLTLNQIVTRESIENALRVLLAIGGSTNAVIHLAAIAGRVGLSVDLQHLNRLSESTPILVNLKPTGQHYMEDFHAAGGVGAVLRELRPLLHLTCRSVTGETLEERLHHRAGFVDRSVIRSIEEPFQRTGGLLALFGNLAPNGSIIKCAAADERLFEHVGRAVVFKGLDDLAARIDDPDLDVQPDDALVLQNAGPIGAGMPEAGYLPIPAEAGTGGCEGHAPDLRRAHERHGLRHRLLHVSPECVIGGPLGLVRSGDRIESA